MIASIILWFLYRLRTLLGYLRYHLAEDEPWEETDDGNYLLPVDWQARRREDAD